jgi:hypothetical protein
MMDEKLKRLREFLTERYLEYRREYGEETTIYKFAKELDVHPVAFIYWMQGRKLPSRDNVDRLANKLGNDIYHILDEPLT